MAARFRIARLLVLALVAACGRGAGAPAGPGPGDAFADVPDGDGGDVPADVQRDVSADVTAPTALGWTIDREAVAVRLTWGETPVASLAGGSGKPAFYLFDTSTGTRTDLVGPAVAATDGDATTLSLSTSDQRAATVRIEPAAEGAVRVTFRVDGRTATERLGADFAVSADEAFYGAMERVVPGDQSGSWAVGLTQGLDLRGLAFDLFVQPSLAAYSPFFVSSAGWGAWIESDWPGGYDFGKADPHAVDLRYEGPALVLRILPGPSPMDVTARYARAVGTTILPPKWAFGPWRWRDVNYNSSTFYDGTTNRTPYNTSLVEDVLMMGAFGIPCAAYWIDRPWGPGSFGYDDLQWDETRVPHAQQMLAWLGTRGTKLLLWIVDWAVGPTMRPEAEAKGYVTTGEMPGSQDGADLLDLTNPDAVAWWQDALGARLKEGVAGFKCDRGEEKEPDGIVVTGTYHDGTSFREGHNGSPRRYAAAVHGAFQRAGIDDAIAFFRAAWVGSQQHAMIWAGDTDASEWGLRSAIIGMQRAAAMHFPFWGSDTCGYLGYQAPREVCMRWLAFSAFSPLMEVGPTSDTGFWARLPDGSVDDWTPYDEPLIAAWILYANLHDSLRDYSYAQAVKSHQDGTMLVRPMAFAFPGHAEYRDLWDQYLYGPDLLVAPVWQPGTTTRDVHVPEGTWRDAWTGQSVTGPTVVTVDVPMQKIPIFVRDGSGLDLGNLDVKWAAALATAHVPPDLGALQAGVR